MPADPITGKTLRWRYDDGPTAGKAFEHSFGRNGKATYSMDGAPAGEKVDYKVARIALGIHLVCYLAPSGWALSTVIDSKSGTIVSVASKEEKIFVQHGRLARAKTASRGATATTKGPRPAKTTKAPRKPSRRTAATRPRNRAAVRSHNLATPADW